LLYFSLFYSSITELITNPHVRSKIFDIMIYFFIVNQQERDYKKNSTIQCYLDDDFIKSNLIISVMRVFIDAERLGTSNQFYEKFSIRNKIFYLIENIMKSHKTVYIEQIKEYANTFKFETTKMVNLLMNDLTFLIDECIEKLMEIKRYQDLKEDVERFNALDEETKQLENQKFADNDRLVKTELKVILVLYSS
jgi:ubiquitin conjugation factor E4 B